MSKEFILSEEMIACSENVRLIRDCSFTKTALIDKEHEKDSACITYLTGAAYMESLIGGKFAGIVCTPDLLDSVKDSFDGGILVSGDPRTAFFEIHDAVYSKWELSDTFIDDTAVIEEGAKISPKGVSVGAGSVIKSGAVIEENVTIGRDCTIMENCVIGAPPFYYYGEGDNARRVYAGCGVVIGDRVCLHAGVAVQAGVFRPVFLGDNVKISNGVHISHDVRVGRNCLLPAGVTLAGLCTLEDNCSLGVGVTVAPGVTVGHGAKLSSGAVVTKQVPPGVRYSGNFAVEHAAYVAHIKNISGK